MNCICQKVGCILVPEFIEDSGHDVPNVPQRFYPFMPPVIPNLIGTTMLSKSF